MRRRRGGFSCIMVVILLLTCLVIQDGVRMAKAAAPPEVRVEPRHTKTVEPPNTFIIYIKVYYITSEKSLYAWQFKLKFNATILNVTGVDMGTFLPSAGLTMWQLGQLAPDIDNVNGLVTAGDTLMLPYPPQGAVGTGSGYLAQITFQVKANGASLLHLDDTELDTLVSNNLYPITPHNRLDGYFEYPAKKHDIAVTAVTASPTSVVVGDLVTIDATVKNEGEVTEAFKVTTYYENETIYEAIETQTFIDLAPSAETTLTFTWNTAGVDAGSYNISAWADLVDRNHPDISLGFIETSADKADNYLYDGEVTLLSPPIASFTHSPTQPITNQTVTFNSNSSDPDGYIISYNWNFGDTNITTVADPVITHTYSSAGTYTVNLTVTDNDGLTDTATDDITVLAHDIAVTNVKASHMGGKTLTVMQGLPVTVTVTVKNNGNFSETFNVTAYYNDTAVGPAQTVTSLSPGSSTIVTFAWDTTDISLGTYTIKAVASNLTGEINTTNNEKTYGTITVALFNKVDYSIDVEGLIFHVIIESNSTVSDLQLTQAEKKISFNVTGPDDTVGYCNVTIPKKLLSANATTPWLVLLDGVNITDTTSIAENDTHTFFYFTYNLTTHKVEIIGANVATPIRPVAIFTPSTTSAYVGDKVTFDASASYDDDGYIISYNWNFGDTNVTTVADPVIIHTYSSAGTYTVNLTVTDNDGLCDSITTHMTISWIRDLAVTRITVSSNLVEIGDPVYINVTAANKGNYPDPESFTVTVRYDNKVISVWYSSQFGKMAPGTEKTLNCTWNTKFKPGTQEAMDPGTYTIKAAASIVTGEINTTNNELTYGTVTVAAPPVAPVASFTISQTPPYYVGDTLTLDASASHDPDGTIVSYEWNFGDETPIVTETEATTTHMYTAAGTYTLTLTITDNQSLTAITTHTVIVSEKHDVAIINVTHSSNEVTVGDLVSINVTVVNNGTQTESFDIIVYYDNLVIGTISVTNLASGASKTLTFDWDTSDADPDTYTIKAATSTITDDINTTNNERIGGTITITAQAAALNIFIYIAAAGAATIILLAIAFYFLRARKHSVKNVAETQKSS